MADRNTIMSWLEGLAEPDWRMFHSDSEVQTISKETLAMLKEQEPVTYKVVKAGEKSYPFYDLVCTGCGNKTGMRMDWKYCPGCGRVVKWDA